MTVISLAKQNSRVEVIKASIPVGTQVFDLDDLNPSIKRFNEFWDFMDTIYLHGYTRAAMSVIGRSAVGTWWSLRKHSEYEKKAREIQRKRLYSFYMMPQNRAWDNIKDYQSFAYKLMIGIMYLRYFGRAAYTIVRNGRGDAIGLDFLPGLVIPNVKDDGAFKEPAFVQYLSRNPKERTEFRDPRDIVYITNPDWEGSPMGSSDIESLASFTLPLDLYLQSAAANYMQNRDRPEVIYQLAEDLDDDSFDKFVAQMRERQAGPKNLGRNPIAVKGELKIDELTHLPSDLPYQEAREDTREEILAVSGTAGAKLGLTRDLSMANLREVRRENHETTMIPIFKIMELGFYEQVHLREFNVMGWEFKFNQPDFLTAVERATVDMRYYGMGADSPNEIRYRRGQPPREDPQGDMYIDQLLNKPSLTNPGSPPEGRPVEPDDPDQVGEPTVNDDPVRGDQHDDEPRGLLDELRKWRAFAIGRKKKKRAVRPFESELIPAELRALIQPYLESADTVRDVVNVFNDVFEGLEDE